MGMKITNKIKERKNKYKIIRNNVEGDGCGSPCKRYTAFYWSN
jgi:hypothetical protein